MKLILLLFGVVLALTAAAPASATFPGQNGAIVYGWAASDGGIFQQGLWTTSPSDGLRAPLLGCEVADAPEACAGFEYTDPAVSPDGRSVVFDAGPTLATVNVDGTGLQLLPARGEDDGQPAFSPDGSRIVFTAGKRFAHTRELWVSDRSGTNARKLPVTGRAPAWSTRNWIAFERRGGVHRMRPDGRGLRRIVRRGYAPAWSPDGRRLAYVGQFRPAEPWMPDGMVAIAGADGTRPRSILHGELVDDIAWSPNGRRLAAVGWHTGLLVVGLHGRVLHHFYGGSESHADQELRTVGIDWQPLP
jgi:hypothetical protein